MLRTEHREAGWPFPFIEYAPAEVAGPLPLIIQLHGAGERGLGGNDLDKVEIHGLAKLAKVQEFPCRILLLQCPPDTFWTARVESVLAFIRRAMDTFPTEKSRVYLTGLSMGGFGTWHTAMAAPELFAAIVPICGGGMAWNAGVLDMPVWVFHGAADTAVKPIHSDMLVEALQARGRDVTYTRPEGVGHNVWEQAYTPELVEWLLSKSR